MAPPAAVRVLLPVPYLRLVADVVGAAGVEVEAWLGRAGLDAAVLSGSSDCELLLPGLQRLFAEAMAAEPAVGVLVGQRLEVQLHGALGYAALCSGSIREAIALLQAFVDTRFSLVAITTQEVDDTLQLSVVSTQPLGPASSAILEAIVLAAKNILDAISFGECRISEVAFAWAATPYAALTETMFGCPVTWRAASTGLRLPTRVLDVPLRSADPAAFTEARQLCERELQRVDGMRTMAGRVLAILLERQQPHGFISLDVTARLLRLTPRTLHRRLVAEGTSFRTLLDELRQRLCTAHLQSGRLSLEEIGWTLGYTDFANFRRTFKRWHGVAPGVWRRNHLSTNVSTVSANVSASAGS
jgi:AraC-like DNA-binding protein